MLIGKNIILEEVRPESIEQLRLWRNNPNLRRHFREWKDITPDQQAKWYAARGNNSNQEHVYFQIMAKDVVARDEKDKISGRRLIGCCNLSYIDWRLGRAEFGVFVAPEEQGKRQGKEALELLFDYFFNDMNGHCVWAEVFDANKAINLYRKLGFKDEGFLRHTSFKDGKWLNSYRISLLREEWEEYKNGANNG